MNERKHYFRDEPDNRTVVVTVMLKTGQYKACVQSGENEDLDVRGYGHSRLAAIADLNDNIAKER
jgi:hypothetical protein